MKKIIISVLILALTVSLFTAPAITAEADGAYTYTYSQVSDSNRKNNSYQLSAQTDPTDDDGEFFSISVSKVFSNDMVLQRNKIIRVWGTANTTDNGYVYGELLGEKRHTRVDDYGNWILEFSPKAANSTGTTLRIYNKAGRSKSFTGVLIGDVWFVTGQSNAEFQFQQMAEYYSTEANRLINTADKIRIYHENKSDMSMAASGKFERTEPVNTAYKWKTVSRTNVNPVSAMGFVCIKKLYDTTGIPQGMVDCGMGGAELNEFYTSWAEAQLPYVESPTAAKWFAYGADQVCWNLFMAPFKHMTFAGLMFYQGESDNEWYAEYADFLTVCVEGWRREFDSDFDFYNVQLSSHAMCTGSFPYLPETRAQQLDAYYRIPDSYLIPSIDCGWRNLQGEDYAHPYDKLTIGTRLANVALAVYYGSNGHNLSSVHAPVPNRMVWNGNTVTVDFDYVGTGLKSYDGGALKGFKVLYEDYTTANATAVVTDYDTVTITLPSSSKKAIAIEYAVIHDAVLTNCNLVNGADVPCLTFRIFNSNQTDSRTLAQRKFFDADFTKESVNDRTGNSTVNTYNNVGSRVTFVQDSSLGKKIARFSGGGLSYNVPDYRLAGSFTLEAYVKMASNDWGYVCGSYYKDSDNTNEYGFALQMGNSNNYGNGFINNLSILETCGYRSKATLSGGKARSKWTHIVFVNDGENGYYYVNGSLVSSSKLLAHRYMDYEKNLYGDFRIGALTPYNNQNTTNMDCAFVRMYDGTATSGEVSALYAAAGNNELPFDPIVTVIRGDVNMDGNITSLDYLALRLYFKGQYQLTTSNMRKAADYNEDGSITSADYLALKRYFAGTV